MSAPPSELQRRHRPMLWIACGLVVGVCLLEVRSDQRVVVRWLPDLPLPPSCASRTLFGIHCPACGLTRSLIHLAHGRWEDSWRTHRIGWLVGLAVLVQFPYRLYALVRQVEAPLGRLFPDCFGYALVFLLVANWLFNVATGAM